MSDPFFSVIIPCYNRRNLLVDALDSIWQQELTDFEVVTVDDGSTDGTEEYLRSLDGRLQTLTQDRRGPGAARNRGLEVARGKYIAFLDSDDIWFPWTLSTYAAVAREHDFPSFIAGSPFRFHSRDSLPRTSSEPLETERFANYFESGDEWRWWGVSSFVIRCEALRTVGGFSAGDMNCEDADLALRLGQERGFVQVTSPVTFGYRVHATNLTNDLRKTVAGVRHMIQKERRGEYPGGRTCALPRRRILTRHIRPVSLDCLRDGRIMDAWEIYRSTLFWHLQLRRWKYLFGFPLRAAINEFRRRQSPAPAQ